MRLPPLEIGQKFGDWTVIAQLENAEQPRVGYSRVRCVCGTEKDIINNRLRRGDSMGCGCIRGRKLGTVRIKHGKSYSPLYRLWQSIKERLKYDSRYVSQGIKMHDPWVTDFEAFETFILSLGPKPTPMHTLDRIEPTGHYEPGNLRWADKTLQSQNRRNAIDRNLVANSRVAVGDIFGALTVVELALRWAQNRNWYGARVRCECGTLKVVKQVSLLTLRTTSCGCRRQRNVTKGDGPKTLEKLITANGETHSLSEWARKTGITKTAIWLRINRLGWDVARAVTEPVHEAAQAVTIDGVTRTVYEWCRLNGIRYGLAYRRIQEGWGPKEAVTVAARRWKKREEEPPAVS